MSTTDLSFLPEPSAEASQGASPGVLTGSSGSTFSELKLCKDCKHFDDGNCTRWRYQEPVRGEIVIPWITASVERASNIQVPVCNTPDPCGPDGKHWQEAPPLPAPTPLPWWKRALGMSNSKVSRARANSPAATNGDKI